jgi:hypothetical protein
MVEVMTLVTASVEAVVSGWIYLVLVTVDARVTVVVASEVQSPQVSVDETAADGSTEVTAQSPQVSVALSLLEAAGVSQMVVVLVTADSDQSPQVSVSVAVLAGSASVLDQSPQVAVSVLVDAETSTM